MKKALSDVIGLGSKTEEYLIAHGVETVEQLVSDGESILLSVPSMSKNRAQNIMQRAHDLLDVTIAGDKGRSGTVPEAKSTPDAKYSADLHIDGFKLDAKYSKAVSNEGNKKDDASNKSNVDKKPVELSNHDAKLDQNNARRTEQLKRDALTTTLQNRSRNSFDAFIYFISVAVCIWFSAYPIYGILNAMEVTPLVSNWWFVGFFMLGSVFAVFFYNDDDHHFKIITLGVFLVMSFIVIKENITPLI